MSQPSESEFTAMEGKIPKQDMIQLIFLFSGGKMLFVFIFTEKKEIDKYIFKHCTCRPPYSHIFLFFFFSCNKMKREL